MTLNDLATLICTKLNQNEAEDLAAAKLFCQRRYEMIWNDQLWKDALIDWTYTLPTSGFTSATNWLPYKQILLLPLQFERPLAVRTDTRHLNVQTHEIFYRADFDAFQNSGAMIDYLLLPPVVWEFDDEQVLLANVANNADLDKAVIVTDMLQADGGTVTRTSSAILSPAATPHLLASGLRLDSATKLSAPSAGIITLDANAFLYPAGLFNLINRSGASVTVQWGPTGGPYETYVLPNLSYTDTFAGNDYSFNGGTFISVPAAFTGIGTITTDLDLHMLQNGTPFATLQAADAGAARRQRIRLLGALDVPAPTIRVLGKSKPNTFTSDNDSTALTGVDNALIAIAEYDMLQRERQFGKAQGKLQEYGAILEQLKKQEVVQQAHNKRITPEDGYGNPYDLYSHSPLSF